MSQLSTAKIKPSDITNKKLVGKGAFGTVYSAYVDNTKVAVKEIGKDRDSGEFTQKIKDAFASELSNLQLVYKQKLIYCKSLHEYVF